MINKKSDKKVIKSYKHFEKKLTRKVWKLKKSFY